MLAITKTELWAIRYALESGVDTDDAISIVDSILDKNVKVEVKLSYEEQCGEETEEDLGSLFGERVDE